MKAPVFKESTFHLAFIFLGVLNLSKKINGREWPLTSDKWSRKVQLGLQVFFMLAVTVCVYPVYQQAIYYFLVRRI